MGVDKSLARLLDEQPDVPLVTAKPRHRGRKDPTEGWEFMTEEERLEVKDVLKGLQRAADDFKKRKEERRRVHIDALTLDQLETIRNTSYIVTKNYRCPTCDGNEFHVAETVGGVIKTTRTCKYKLFEITMSCMKAGCGTARVKKIREPIEWTAEDRLREKYSCQITITT